MSDFTARQIHLADQATPDLLAAVDHFTNDPAVCDDLTNDGEATTAANLTRQWIGEEPLRLATWAAGLAIRLIQANRRLEELTDELVTARGQARQARIELAWITDGPGPDTTEVYDADGDRWVRDGDQWRHELWPAAAPARTWAALVSYWGPITAEKTEVAR